MVRSFACLAVLVLLASTGPEASAQGSGGYEAFMDRMFQWGEYAGMLAIGWGTGVSGWMATGHQALGCLISDFPRAWKLWQKDVLTSRIPIFKYGGGGVLFLGAGFFLVRWLLGLWTRAFEFGIFAGVVAGAVWSFGKVRRGSSPIDFLLANRRHVDEDKVPMFKQID